MYHDPNENQIAFQHERVECNQRPNNFKTCTNNNCTGKENKKSNEYFCYCCYKAYCSECVLSLKSNHKLIPIGKAYRDARAEAESEDIAL